MEGWWHSAGVVFWDEVSAFGDANELVRSALRLLLAAAAGALIGVQRMRTGKNAGARTHMLVALGSALTVQAALAAGMGIDGASRVIQGVAAGVGFIGGGVILKLTEKEEVHGLTTAAGLWMTAALGIGAGLGRYLSVILGALLAWFVLGVVRWLEVKEGGKKL